MGTIFWRKLMFERELRDLSFVKRWSIVRTIRSQSVAEHTFFVAMYANDICAALGVDESIHLAVLQKALWHDVDEIFTGDIPGPAKRALCSDRESLTAKLKEWKLKVFGILGHREGVAVTDIEHNIIHTILKAADELDAACEMATELQLGNNNVQERVIPPLERGLTHLDLLKDLLKVPEDRFKILRASYAAAPANCEVGSSKGPNVFGDGFIPQ
jgi:5'-deoxynucleotidase